MPSPEEMIRQSREVDAKSDARRAALRAVAVTANMEVDSGVEPEVTWSSQSGGRDSVSAAPVADVVEIVAVAMPKVGAHGSAFNGDNFFARTND